MIEFIVTHPRAGGSLLASVLKYSLGYKVFSGFLTPSNPNSFGEAAEIYYDLQRSSLYGTRINALTFDNETLKEIQIEFRNPEHVLEWARNEITRRVMYINSNTQENLIVDHFFTHIDGPQIIGKNTISLEIELLFLYRKNLLESILSNLIKNKYFSRRKYNLSANTAHNIENSIETLYPIESNATLNQSEISNILDHRFLGLYNYYKIDNKRISKILSYEDNVLQNSSILLQGQEINVMSCFSNLKQKEYPMKYGVEKKLFFKNTQLISEIIHSKVKKYSLEDVFSELDIKYDL